MSQHMLIDLVCKLRNYRGDAITLYMGPLNLRSSYSVSFERASDKVSTVDGPLH